MRVQFQAKARKILAEVDRLNKEERDQVQRGLDLNIIAVLPHAAVLPVPQKAQVPAPCTLPQTFRMQQVTTDAEDAGPRRRQKRAVTWYSEPLSPRQGKTTAMLPPSPRRRRSARTAQRNIDTAQARAAELAAVASASHAAAEGAPAGHLALRTRSQTRATSQHSPTAHASCLDQVSTDGPATPSPCVAGSTQHWRQRQATTCNMPDAKPECPHEENSGQLIPNPTAHSQSPSTWFSPREDPTGARLNTNKVSEWPSPLGKHNGSALDVLSPAQHLCGGPQELLTPNKKPFLQDGSSGLHEFSTAEALLSPALQAVCSGLDLSKLDSDALALSPINHGLSPLTLSLTDLPSPLNALPALISPCPDALQSPTVLPCLPHTPRKVCDLEMTPDAHLRPGSLRLLSKPSGDKLSNSLRRRAAVTRALAESFLQSPRDAQMINVRDLGSFISPREPAQH